MPKVSAAPEKLRPYEFHGVELNYRNGDKQAVADECPWCGREGKFEVEIETGVWKCWVCGEGNEKGGGNATVFLRMLHARSIEATTDYEPMRRRRGLLYTTSLIEWGVCRSYLTGDWLVPGYNAERNLVQLYKVSDTILLPTPTLGHAIFGANLFNPDVDLVYLCEGWGDGIALWEALSLGKDSDGGWVPTANRGSCLLTEANVLAVPGCSIGEPFRRVLPLFADREVVILFDSDHPRRNPTGGVASPAGYEGAKRAAELLSKSKTPPTSISLLTWGESGYDPGLKSGYDLGDLLCRR